MHFFVQWYIKNAKDYLFNIKDDIGESTVKVSAESSMRQIIGRVKISEALSEQRQEIEQRVKTLLQGLLDNYNSGVEIVNVGILYSYVAPEVRDAYRDIQSARADKEGEINNAMAYKNDIIPRARGEAQAIIEEAKGYKESVIARAAGEAERFRNIFSQYQNARDITRKRMYIEAMEQVLKDVNKIVIDKSMTGKTLSLLPIQDLIKK
jgi:membrane protease subunit HflK